MRRQDIWGMVDVLLLVARAGATGTRTTGVFLLRLAAVAEAFACFRWALAFAIGRERASDAHARFETSRGAAFYETLAAVGF